MLLRLALFGQSRTVTTDIRAPNHGYNLVTILWTEAFGRSAIGTQDCCFRKDPWDFYSEMAESNGTETGKTYPSGTIAKVAYDILNDTFYNIIHDVVAKVHRDEKVARMRSAVVIARQKAEEEAAKNREEAGAKGSGSVKPSGPDAEEQSLKEVRVETDAAIFDNGKAYLKGNPMQTTKEIICPECRLPRLLYPVTGVGARAVPDPDREYCSQQPLIRKPGHDVHGNLFATDKVNSKKKNKHNTPTSSPPADGHAAPEAPGFPTTKCLNCPRYFVVSRVQQHMDRCMGYSGRNATRNRGSGDTGSGSTPTPSTSTSAAPKRPLADDDATPSTTLTKKKKLNAPKKLSKPPAASSKLKNGLTPDDFAENGDADIKSEANGDD